MTLKAYTLPLLISLTLHALVFALVFSTWESRPKEREVQRPRVVQAKVVEYTAKSQRQAEQQAAQQKVIDMRRQQQARERQEAERRRQQEEARRAQAQREREQKAQAERERQEAERRRREQAEAEQRRREQELQAEQERLERQQQLDRALAEEAEFFEEQQAQQVAQSYVDVMAQRIENNWSRPPSARLGMQCVLEIQLVPTGQVVSVTVVESSGNSAFDRSAEQAVKRIDRFEEIQGMPSQVFESQFRQLRLVFKPEDLRL